MEGEDEWEAEHKHEHDAWSLYLFLIVVLLDAFEFTSFILFAVHSGSFTPLPY